MYTWDVLKDIAKHGNTLLTITEPCWNPCTKVSIPCNDDHQFKEEELTSVGELSEVCSQIVLKMSCSVTNL